MPIKRTLILAAAASLGLGSAEAQTYTAAGAGNDSCGTWSADRRVPYAPPALQDTQWILGFLSGVGFMAKVAGIDPLHGVDSQAVLAWIDNYCRDNPLSSIADAGAAFKYAHPR